MVPKPSSAIRPASPIRRSTSPSPAAFWSTGGSIRSAGTSEPSANRTLPSWLSGQGEANLRADAAIAFFYRPDDRWTLGYESRALSFRDPAPVPGLRLYWDPEWSWTNSAVLGWAGEFGSGWELEARAVPGVAWLQERDRDAAAVFELSGSLDVSRRIGDWTIGGNAGYGQSRLDGYRTFRFGIEFQRAASRVAHLIMNLLLALVVVVLILVVIEAIRITITIIITSMSTRRMRSKNR